MVMTLMYNNNIISERKTRQKKKNKTKWLHDIFLITHTLVILLPLVWIVLTSFKSNPELMRNPYGLPERLLLSNYAEAWKTVDMPNLFKNSIFICSVSVICIIFVSSMASYAFSRFTLKINSYIYNFILIGMMIPLNAAIIPLFINIRKLGLLNSYAGVIIPYTAVYIPVSTFLITAYMKNIPNEVEEAAVIDGCGILKLFTHIIIPLSKPIFATMSIIAFMNLWNEFLFALVFLSGTKQRTIPIGIAAFKEQYFTNYTMMMAGTVMAIIPPILIYIVLREHIIKGIAAGAVKG